MALATALCFFLISCSPALAPRIHSVPVEDTDAHGISLDQARGLRPGDPEQAVIGVLGEPADRQQSCLPNEIVWRYAIAPGAT